MKIYWLLLISFLLALPAGAEEKLKVGEVVVTAAKISEALEETTSEVTVIKGEEIRMMNVSFLPDVLRRVPDLSLVQNGGDGKVTSVFLRGGDSKHTLVMIDGVKVNSNTTGSFDFSTISVNDIERIEIVKGAQSTIYGSEAVAGVINIITKKGDGRLKAVIAFEGGAQGTYNPSATVSGGDNSLNYRVSASYFKTRGISVAKDGTERDEYKNATASWKFGSKPTKNAEIEFFGKYSYDRSDLDDFSFTTGRAIDSLTFVQRSHHLLLGGQGKLFLFDKWEQVLSLSTYRDHLLFVDPSNVYNESDIITSRNVVDWQNNLYLNDAVTLTGGFEYRVEKGENKGNFDESIDNKAFYFNGKVKLLGDRLILNAGLRNDDHETAGSKVTYKVGAAYQVKETGTTVRSSYGTGFRAPAMNDLFFPFYGSPNLKPETSKSFEAGLSQSLLSDRLSLAATYFAQEYKNLIQADPLTFTAANIAKASVNGFELNGTVKVTDAVGLKAGYTYLDTKDKTTNLPLIRRPKNKFSAGVTYASSGLSLLADCIYVGDRFDSSGDAKKGLKNPSYTVVNLSGSYAATKKVTVFARVENLFDKNYEEIRGFSSKGTSVYGGVRTTF